MVSWREITQATAEFCVCFGVQRLVAEEQHLMLDQRVVEQLDHVLSILTDDGSQIDVAHLGAQRRRPSIDPQCRH